MAYTYKIKRKILIELNGEEDQVLELFNALFDMCSSSTCECDFEYQLTTADYAYSIWIIETGTETRYPGCYTLSNGDPGYPDEYEDDLEFNDDVIEEYVGEFKEAREYNFEYFVTSGDERD